MVSGSKLFGVTYDILHGLNATVWSGVKKGEKTVKIVKIGLPSASLNSNTCLCASHAMK